MMNATIPTPRPLAPLAKRRRLVAVTYGGFLLCLTLFLLGILVNNPDLSHLASSLVVFTPLGAIPMLAGWLGTPRAGVPGLDERQRQQVTRAYMQAYGAVMLVLGLLLALLTLVNVTDMPLHAVPVRQYASFAAPTMLMLAALPTALLAWTEPDDREEEQ